MADNLPTVMAPIEAIQAARKEPGFKAVMQKVLMHASAYSPEDFVSVVYLAGLWHGSELMREKQANG